MSRSTIIGVVVGAVVTASIWMMAAAEAVPAPASTTTTSTVVELTTTSSVAPSTTTSTTTTTTTTTTTLPAAVTQSAFRCPVAMKQAYRVGWPVDELAKLDRIVYRESRCDPTAHNKADPNSGSYGYAQLNGFWCRGTDSYLQELGLISSCEDLFRPGMNLRSALAIWQRSGWNPWGG